MKNIIPFKKDIIFKTNILSLGQLMELGYLIYMNGNVLYLRDQNNELLAQIEMSKNKMYKLNLVNSRAKCLKDYVEDSKDKLPEIPIKKIKVVGIPITFTSVPDNEKWLKKRKKPPKGGFNSGGPGRTRTDTPPSLTATCSFQDYYLAN